MHAEEKHHQSHSGNGKPFAPFALQIKEKCRLQPLISDISPELAALKTTFVEIPNADCITFLKDQLVSSQ